MQAPLDSCCFSSYFTNVTNCVDMPEHTKVISHAGVLRSDGEFLEMSFLYLSNGEASDCCLLLEGNHVRSQNPKSGNFFPPSNPLTSGAPF